MDEVQAVHRDREWHRISAGAGSKGECWYDWQAHVAFAPRDCEPGTIVGVAGRRWHVESAFEAARQETGLDSCEVRSAEGWRRHVTLVLWALALLAVVRAADLERPDPQKKSPGTHSLTAFRRLRGLAGG